MGNHQIGHRLLGKGGRLQECAWRQDHRGIAERDHRLARLDDDFAVDGQPREALCDSEFGQQAALALAGLAGALGCHVEAGSGGGDGHVKGLRRRADHAGQHAQPGHRRDDLGQRNRAFGYVDDFAGERAVEAEDSALIGPAGGEGDAAARVRRAGHDVGHRDVDAARHAKR